MVNSLRGRRNFVHLAWELSYNFSTETEPLYYKRHTSRFLEFTKGHRANSDANGLSGEIEGNNTRRT